MLFESNEPHHNASNARANLKKNSLNVVGFTVCLLQINMKISENVSDRVGIGKSLVLKSYVRLGDCNSSSNVVALVGNLWSLYCLIRKISHKVI